MSGTAKFMETASSPARPTHHAAIPAAYTRLRRCGPAALAAIAALLIYACTLGGTYVYDDVMIQNDPRMTQPRLWGQFITQAYSGSVDKLYRPLTSFTFALQRFGGNPPWAMHLVNWLLNAAAAAAVAELGFRLAGPRVAYAAGLLFAAHPAHVEAVAGLVGRAELLCTLATVCGLCLFLSRRITSGRVVAICLLFVVAVLSKEQGMLFPLLLLALIPFRRAAGRCQPLERQQRLWLAAGLCYLLAGYVLIRQYLIGFSWDRAFLEWAMNPMVRSQGADRVLMPFVLIGRYAVLLVAPHAQSLDYGGRAIGWIAHWNDPYLYLGFAATIAWIIGVALSVRARRWAIAFCLLGLAITYGMVANIVALIGTNFAERLIYLPSVFFLLLIALALAALPRVAAAALVAGIVLVGGWATFAYARLWNTPMALYEYCVRNQPRAERPYALLFTELSKDHRWMEARDVARAAARANPDCDPPYGMQIQADLALGDLADARAALNAGMHACTEFDRLALVGYGQQIADAEKAAAARTQPARQ